MRYFLSFVFLYALLNTAYSQQQQIKKLLYGVAYYDEYMPYERLDKDVKMMQEAGINVVRIADCFGPTVTESEVKANADYMAANLKKDGWEYIVVDIRWYVANDKAHGYNETDPQYNIE